MEKSELLSVKEASDILGISPATVKNWIKLGKLKGHQKGASFLLSKEDVDAKCVELTSSNALRSRRNKSRLTSNFVPRSYISSSSPNYKTIKKLVLCQEISEYDKGCILAWYAESLMKKAGISKKYSEGLLSSLIEEFAPSYASVSKDLSDLLSEYPLVLSEGEDTLGMLYLSLRSMQDKKSTGAYYTPYFVVDELIEKALGPYAAKELSNSQILDPSCGTGNFLLRLPENIPLSNIHGYDIDSMAVFLSRINLAIKYRITTEKELACILSNLQPWDFLFSKSLPRKDFDIVIGNPPWGYAYTAAQNKLLKAKYSSFDGSGKPESFSLFIERALNCSQDVTFLLPETILSSDYHEGIREFILSHAAVTGISYLGEAFDKVQCPSVILRLSRKKDHFSIAVSFYKKDSNQSRKLQLLRSFEVGKDRISSDNFNILADSDEYEILKKMEATAHFTLKDNCDFALGIVSGANRSLLTDHETPGSEPIIKGKDISKYYIDTASSYTVFEPWRYQQVAPEKFYRSKDKLFYRFIAPEPIVALDNKGLLSLNSANIMIPHVKGYSNAYIMAVLNSSAMSFYYRHTCKNMKVLRSVLESLPIPCCDHLKQQEIVELALKITQNKIACNESCEKLINRLDYLVASLYNLYTNDIKKIMK